MPKVRYLGTDENILSLEALKSIYKFVAVNLKKAQARKDMVLIKDHTTTGFDPVYIGNFRIVTQKGNQLEIMPSARGKAHMIHMSGVKYVLPAEQIIDKLPDYPNVGIRTGLRLNPNNIPDLGWNLATSVNTVFTNTPIKLVSGCGTTNTCVMKTMATLAK